MAQNLNDSNKSKQILSKIFLLIGTALVFLAGFVLGGSYELNRQALNLSEFWKVYSLVENRYVGEIDKKQAVDGVIRGFVEGLGDPFSSYLSQKERDTLSEELSGEFEGIGARLEEKDNQITVVAPLSDSPAEKAGLKAKDIILTINEESTESMTLDQAVSKIRGPKDTPVKLTVFREGSSRPLEFSITRRSIVVPSVSWEMKQGVGYIEISQFGDDTVPRFKQAVSELKAKNPSAMILDLRNNPGGYLNDVPPIAGAFLPPSVVTIQKYKDKKTEELRSTEVPALPDIKLFVLINGGSASASEILAGALQDHARATLVGSKTFGKGSVQDIIPLGKGSALRLTIAEWLTPKGRVVNKTGIEPDVKIEAEKTENSDPVLDKALELAKQQ